jgi:hypothetical protein
MSQPSSVSKNKNRKKPARKHIGSLSTDYTALYPEDRTLRFHHRGKTKMLSCRLFEFPIEERMPEVC